MNTANESACLCFQLQDGSILRMVNEYIVSFVCGCSTRALALGAYGHKTIRG